MTGNPFLDPAREIQQGRSEEDILASHERRLAEAAEDAAMRPPAGSRSVGDISDFLNEDMKKYVDEKLGKDMNRKFTSAAASMAAAGAAGVAAGVVGGVAAGAALGAGIGAYLPAGLGASLYGSWASEKLKKELINYTPKEEEKNLIESNLYGDILGEYKKIDEYKNNLYDDSREEGDDGAA